MMNQNQPMDKSQHTKKNWEKYEENRVLLLVTKANSVQAISAQDRLFCLRSSQFGVSLWPKLSESLQLKIINH